jgi:hypothetical protein
LQLPADGRPDCRLRHRDSRPGAILAGNQLLGILAKSSWITRRRDLSQIGRSG